MDECTDNEIALNTMYFGFLCKENIGSVSASPTQLNPQATYTIRLITGYVLPSCDGNNPSTTFSSSLEYIYFLWSSPMVVAGRGCVGFEESDLGHPTFSRVFLALRLSVNET